MIKTILFFSLTFAILVCVFGNNANNLNKHTVLLPPILRPEFDNLNYNYRAILLKNRLRCLLISTPNETKSAAGMSITVGSFNDPDEFPGLAHFVEHMLFLGNKKYPEENGLVNLLTINGGNFNAETWFDKTIYYYHVNPDKNKEALDHFAQFFVSPSFTESAIEREVEAVNSEFIIDYKSEQEIGHGVELYSAKQGHPYTKSTPGSAELLLKLPKSKGLDLRNASFEFFHRYHSANIMNLVVSSPESLDELQSQVENMFWEIPNKNISAEFFDNPYGPDELGERVDVLIIGENMRKLVITFPIPYVTEYYETSALGYIDILIKREGPGSLLSYLKRENWGTIINTVKMGWDTFVRGFSFYKIEITLTEQGYENINSVVKNVFQYIDMIRRDGINKSFWEEIRELTNLKYRFQGYFSADDRVKYFVRRVDKGNLQNILYWNFVEPNATFKSEEIYEFLKHLVPQNCRIFVKSNFLKNAVDCEIHPNYHTKFKRQKINDSVISDWTNVGNNYEYYIPLLNEFIPTKFDPKSKDKLQNDSLIPRKLMESNLTEVWYFQDLKLPKAIINAYIDSPLTYVNPINYVLSKVFVNLIDNSISDFGFPASLAGLDYEIVNNQDGIKLKFNGYNDKIGLFIRKIFESMLRTSYGDSEFVVAKNSTIRDLQKEENKDLDVLGKDQVYFLLKNKYWSTEELLQAIQDTSLEDMKEFIHDYLSKIKIIWTFIGNLNPEECVTLSKDIEDMFVDQWKSCPLLESQLIHSRVVKLPKGSNFVQEKVHSSDSGYSTLVVLQVYPGTTKNKMLLKLLQAISYPFCWDILRTKEHLGYHVETKVYQINSINHFVVLVEGPIESEFVEERIASFFVYIGSIIENMEITQFEEHRNILYNDLSISPKTLKDLDTRVFSELRTPNRNFQRPKLELEILKSLKLGELQKFYKDYIFGFETRRKISVHVVPKNNSNFEIHNKNGFENFIKEEGNKIRILNPITWKQSMALCPSIN